MCQAQVAVPRQCHAINDIPFLPYKPETREGSHGGGGGSSDGLPSKTYRISCRRCLLERREGLCTHSLEDRSFRSVYTLCEVAFAASLGYQILEIDEALLYTEQKRIFSSFFKLCASYKIRYDTVPEFYRDKLDLYCKEINEGMSFTEFELLTPDMLVSNPSEKLAAKQLMNRVIG